MNVKNKYSTVYFHVFCHKKEQRNGIVARRGIAREAVFCFLFFDIYLFCCAKSWLQHARSSVFTGACKLLAVARVYLGPWPGVEPRPPTLEAQSLSHWTTKDIPVFCLFLYIDRMIQWGEETDDVVVWRQNLWRNVLEETCKNSRCPLPKHTGDFRKTDF